MKRIILKYTLNGAKFRREYGVLDYEGAAEHVALLESNGVAVEVKNWPRRIPVPTLNLAVKIAQMRQKGTGS